MKLKIKKHLLVKNGSIRKPEASYIEATEVGTTKY